jgi:2-polyprenyl-6-hydroxyphenyl methylase/3-demethylubiquinone-9 3-methyltransferase
VSADNLKNVDSHFAFGKNWASYARLIDEPQIEEAKRGLLALIPEEDFKGNTFLDIGCGSGLHGLAAARLGASRIVGMDIDSDSVMTTKALLSGQKLTVSWRVENISVFDVDPERHGKFGIVYSWGVLHHTGSMWEAIGKAAGMVAPGGLLAIALYRTTSADGFWKLEKHFYSRAPALVQKFLQGIYVAAFRLAQTIRGGGGFSHYVANYKSSRGMDFHHDVHDWLGGYPYETAIASEVDHMLTGLGFEAERVLAGPKSRGILGSGCDEYVYRLRR